MISQKPHPMQIVRHGSDVSIQMYTEETTVNVAPGVPFHAWTFDGVVPGPVILLKQGDHVALTLHNLDPLMAHSIDLHAALCKWSTRLHCTGWMDSPGAIIKFRTDAAQCRHHQPAGAAIEQCLDSCLHRGRDAAARSGDQYGRGCAFLI